MVKRDLCVISVLTAWKHLLTMYRDCRLSFKQDIMRQSKFLNLIFMSYLYKLFKFSKDLWYMDCDTSSNSLDFLCWVTATSICAAWRNGKIVRKSCTCWDFNTQHSDQEFLLWSWPQHLEEESVFIIKTI